MITVCSALSNNRVCTSIPSTSYKGKYLCLPHLSLLKGGELLDWAPKRMIEWEYNRRIFKAAQEELINQLNMEANNGVQR
jgi:hypothetical protein